VGELTVKTNDVAFVSDPAADVTVTVKLPVAVEESVEMLSVVEQVGVQEVCVNVPVAPEGKPVMANPAVCVVPERSVAVTVFEVDCP
jgi:hypothetical protein